jgi:hypothetical protein
MQKYFLFEKIVLVHVFFSPIRRIAPDKQEEAKPMELLRSVSFAYCFLNYGQSLPGSLLLNAGDSCLGMAWNLTIGTIVML